MYDRSLKHRSPQGAADVGPLTYRLQSTHEGTRGSVTSASFTLTVGRSFRKKSVSQPLIPFTETCDDSALPGQSLTGQQACHSQTVVHGAPQAGPGQGGPRRQSAIESRWGVCSFDPSLRWPVSRALGRCPWALPDAGARKLGAAVRRPGGGRRALVPPPEQVGPAAPCVQAGEARSAGAGPLSSGCGGVRSAVRPAAAQGTGFTSRTCSRSAEPGRKAHSV